MKNARIYEDVYAYSFNAISVGQSSVSPDLAHTLSRPGAEQGDVCMSYGHEG